VVWRGEGLARRRECATIAASLFSKGEDDMAKGSFMDLIGLGSTETPAEKPPMKKTAKKKTAKKASKKASKKKAARKSSKKAARKKRV
jgi:hypothetical protein